MSERAGVAIVVRRAYRTERLISLRPSLPLERGRQRCARLGKMERSQRSVGGSARETPLPAVSSRSSIHETERTRLGAHRNGAAALIRRVKRPGRRVVGGKLKIRAVANEVMRLGRA